MNYIRKIINEQIKNYNLIFKMAKYETKSKYQMHYLGILWQFLMPLVQIGVYWFIFGVGIRSRQPIDDIPFIAWLIAGIIPWFFISSSVIQGSNSVYAKINLVSKMKFPVSVLPSIAIVSNGMNFIIMLILAQIILIINNIYPTVQTFQLIYYIVAAIALVFALALLFSSLSTIARDFQNVLQSAMRLLFFLTPILWDPSRLPDIYHNILKLNPFYYLIIGFRQSFLSQGWIYQSKTYGLYFWTLVITIMLIGSYLHVKFRDKFVDYI